MVTRLETKSGKRAKVRFFHPAPLGHTVSLAGVFNDWDPASSPMTYSAEENGYFCILTLSPGVYEYKLVVDGEWLLDEDNPNFVSNDFGTLNSLLSVD